MSHSHLSHSVPATNQPGQSDQLEPLARYLTGLWKVGGLPLVMIGLGAANLFLPTSAAYGEAEQIVITGFLFGAGVIAWVTLVALAFKRWQSELQCAVQQDTAVIEAVVRLVEHMDSDAAAKDRVNTLTASLASLRVGSVRPFIGPATGSAEVQ